MNRSLDVIYFDVTSGHRSAALALQRAFGQRHHGLKVRCVNLLDLLAGHRALQGIARAGIDFFNWGMREELALFPAAQIAAFQRFQRALPDAAAESVSTFWREHDPAAVVSVIPICNHFLSRALHRARPDCPYIVVAVDFEEALLRYWFDPAADAHYLCPSSKLMARCLAAGIPASRCVSVPGMPIDPAFYEGGAIDRARALTDAGLDPSQPTVLVSFGGQGSVFVESCARRLADLGPAWNVIFLCGRNDAGRARLERLATPYRKRVLGFTPEPPAAWYALADVIIGKPGSMTITEALVSRKAMVAVTAKSLAVVQRGNERWLRDANVGEVVDLHDLGAAVRRSLENPARRASIEGAWHRGVYDITHQIARIADLHHAPTEPAACSD